jgi:hypothetical protein
MEVLKLVRELGIMATHLKVKTLRQGRWDNTSRDLITTITHFQATSIESSDYRSAFHMTLDWLYGWNVDDSSQHDEEDIRSYMAKVRAPRKMTLTDEWEREEM